MQEEINEITAKREPLELFKSAVSSSQESFQSLNAQAETILANLDGIKSNCLTAEKYAEGMADTLSGFGTGVVSLAFDGLLLSIEAKLTTLAQTIRGTALEANISVSKGSIVTSLQTQITSLKALGESVAVLVETTAQVTQSARDTFYDTDEALAKW